MKPALKFCPLAEAAMSQSTLGMVLLPPLSYGPCRLSLRGPVSDLRPFSVSETSRLTLALLIGVEKAWLSVSVTLPELLLPQAASAATRAASDRSTRVR